MRLALFATAITIAALALLWLASPSLAQTMPPLALQCPSAEVARADADLVTAQAAYYACPTCPAALALVGAAVERKVSAIAATCPRPEPAMANVENPFEPADPNEITPEAEAAWLADLMGYSGTP